MVRPATAAEAEPLQKTEVSEAQVPEKTWKRPLAPTAPPTVIVGFVACATKEYQTSGLPTPHAKPAIAVNVEFTKVPAVGEQAWADVSETGELQTSLPGASITQMLKLPLITGRGGIVVEYTLT